jgi:hypothetical protein
VPPAICLAKIADKLICLALFMTRCIMKQYNTVRHGCQAGQEDRFVSILGCLICSVDSNPLAVLPDKMNDWARSENCYKMSIISHTHLEGKLDPIQRQIAGHLDPLTQKKKGAHLWWSKLV